MWRIIFSAIFLILCHNTLSFTHKRHRDWTSDFHDHDCSDSDESNSHEFFPSSEESDISNSGPDSDDNDSPEFPSHHPDDWGHGHHNDDSPSNEDSSPEEWPSKDKDKDSEPYSHEKHHHCHFCHHKHKCHYHGRFNKTSTTTTRQELTTKELTTESTTKPTTKSVTKPTTTTRSTTVSTTKPTTTRRSTTEVTKPTNTRRSTTETITKPTTTTRSTTVSTTKPTTTRRSTTEVTKPTTTRRSTTETITKPTTMTRSTTVSTTKPTTTRRSTTEVTKPTTTRRSTTETITKPTTTTRSTTVSTTKLITTTESTTTTNINQDFANCIRLCIVTSEYNPVCGTDLVTYDNLGRLICAQRCGLDVKVLKRTVCPRNRPQPSSTSQSPLTTTTAKVNSETPSETQAQQNCIKACASSTELRPVCGTNDITYKNGEELLCAQFCGVDVQLKYMSSCVQKSVSTTSIPLDVTTPLPILVRLCIKSCPIMEEDKPICGTNDVTYKNPSHLQCAQTCGVNVQMKHKLPCQNQTQKVVTTTPRQLSSNKSSQEICIDTCFKNSEYKPVCGSNNVTYSNKEHLQCARACLVDVKLQTLFACEKSSVVPEITSSENPGNVLTTSTMSAPEFTNGPQDQNGSNNVSDKNPTTTEGDGIDFRSGDST